MRRRRLAAAGVVLLLCASAGWVILRSGKEPPEVRLARAERALEAGDAGEAERLARGVLEDEPESAEALMIAASSVAARDPAAAVGLYEQVPEDDAASVEAHCRAADILFYRLGRFSDAERHFRAALERSPTNEFANGGLAYLMVISGRRWASAPHLLALVRQDRFTVDQLSWLGVLEAVIDSTAELERCAEAIPGDPYPKLGLARLALRDNRMEEAERLLREVVAAAPEDAEAQARYGTLLVQGRRVDELREWQGGLPSSADGHPEVWVVRAEWAEIGGDVRGSVRCLGEALRLDPNHQLANYRMARQLAAMGDAAAAEPFARRSRKLVELADAIHHLQQVSERDLPALHRCARLTAELGRLWESRAWCLLALATDPSLDWARRQAAQLTARLNPGMPQTVPDGYLALALDLDVYPLPRWEQVAVLAHAGDAARTDGGIRFDDEAAGLDFRYFNGRIPGREGTRTYEVNGGGVAVLDFDLDAWPDLCLTQGCDWPPQPGQTRRLDRLFRNHAGTRLTDVTEAARLREDRFSQGVAVGDFDGDGFPDLYVANIGRNRLYRNCGDGTFVDVTDAAGLSADAWTSSCLIADLNGDGLADLYDVNYLQGEDIYDRVCRFQDGVARACPPRIFEGAPDQLFLNLGDGRFQDVSSESGILAPEGKGLGIVAADLDGSGQLSLFVANDQVPNFWLRNRTDARGGAPRFTEEGLLSGLALDADGRPQACMGVAAGDADGDGQLDLFVTNFHNESNTLYLQEGPHVFQDATRDTGLREPSFAMLGFGTQFLDADLDGWEDLVLVNGHVEDLTDVGIPYRMRSQVFRNLGAARFMEISAGSLGPWFSTEQLGRGLARLDWNRDGRDDFVVSDLEAPASLLTNRTLPAGHFLAVELRGVASARDAIGTAVRVRSGGREAVRWLVAGDGFQASNHRRLVFGLGERTRIEELSVQWPSGASQSWSDLDADSELMLIEGRAAPLAMPR